MVNASLERLTWFGHACFLLRAGDKNIYFDPFQLSGNPPPADLILISHEHYDHCSPEDIAKIKKAGTVIVTEKQSAEKLQDADIKILAPGDSFNLGNILIEAVPSYNTNKQFHPETNGWIGFIITVDGVRMYHAGDTDYIPEMKSFQADIALLPVSGTYVMTPEEAAQAALDIKPQTAVPMHYGSIVGTTDDAERFADLLKDKISVKILPRE